MNSVRSGVARVLTGAVMAGQALGLTPTASAAEKKVEKATTDVASRDSDRNPDTVELAANKPDSLDRALESSPALNEEMVTKKDGTQVTKTEYINSVINDAVRDGILKSQSHKDFQIKDTNGRLIDDKPKYEAYIQSIKDKANQFKDVKKFSGVFNGIRDLTKSSRPEELILTPKQVELLMEHPDMVEVYRKVGTLYGGLNQGIKTEKLQKYAATYIADLKRP